MSDQNDDPGFDWASPRWREGEDAQRAVERERRFWDRRPPGQHGAIDAGDSVPGQPDEEPIGSVGEPSDQPPAAPGQDGPTNGRRPSRRSNARGNDA